MPITDVQVKSRRQTAYLLRGRPLTYKALTSDTPNYRTGDVDRVFNDVSVALALVSARPSGKSETIAVAIRQSELTSLSRLPHRGDMIVWDEKNWHVESWEQDQTKFEYLFQCTKP